MGRGAVAQTRGFTLLELIVTMAIVAVVVGLTIPAVGRFTEGIRVRAEVAGFSALLRHARERAIVSQKPQAVVVERAVHEHEGYRKRLRAQRFSVYSCLHN